MYYATRRTDNSKRLIGLATVVVICGGLLVLLAYGKLGGVINEITETEVAIIEVPEIEEEEPPPPPPVDVELPPPPPSVILPDFVFDQTPSAEVREGAGTRPRRSGSAEAEAAAGEAGCGQRTLRPHDGGRLSAARPARQTGRRCHRFDVREHRWQGVRREAHPGQWRVLA